MNRLPLETFSSVLVLAEEHTEGNTLHADSNSLATLLLVRDLQTERKAEVDKREELFPPTSRRRSSYVRPAPNARIPDYQGVFILYI
jgi:ion channel POLLUX/CASTOR